MNNLQTNQFNGFNNQQQQQRYTQPIYGGNNLGGNYISYNQPSQVLPSNYDVYQQQNMQYAQNARGGTGIVWVQGEAGAKAYPVQPNNTVMLMDSENNVFYIKTTDASGVPLPLRVFEYSERNVDKSNITNNIVSNQQDNEYITRQEFEERIALLSKNTEGRKRNNNEPTIQSSDGERQYAAKPNKRNSTTL